MQGVQKMSKAATGEAGGGQVPRSQLERPGLAAPEVYSRSALLPEPIYPCFFSSATPTFEWGFLPPGAQGHSCVRPQGKGNAWHPHSKTLTLADGECWVLLEKPTNQETELASTNSKPALLQDRISAFQGIKTLGNTKDDPRTAFIKVSFAGGA